MKPVINKSPRAKADILDLAEFLARSSLAVAERFIDAAEASIQDLILMPEMGNPWETENPRLRGLRYRPVKGFKNHLVFYRVTAESIDIVRVLHATRDLDAIVG